MKNTINSVQFVYIRVFYSYIAKIRRWLKNNYTNYYEAEEDINENIDEFYGKSGWEWYDDMIDWEATEKLNKWGEKWNYLIVTNAML